MFKSLIQAKLSPDEKNGIFVSPALPAVRLGKILMNDRRISQPGDVVALHLEEGFFGQTIILLTGSHCYFDGGSFALGEVRQAVAEGRTIRISLNRSGALSELQFKAGNEVAAKSLCRIFEETGREQQKSETQKILPQKSYEGFDKKELDWLKLRDEVLATIDALYEKFNDGKISLLEYEETKADLLSRL